MIRVELDGRLKGCGKRVGRIGVLVHISLV